MAPRRFSLKSLRPHDALLRVLPPTLDAPLDASFEHDGQRINARSGEPLALSLLAAGALTLSRSTKYHRPRGAMCMRGACEGCLVRVGDTPDVMACQTPCRDGMRVTSQNAFPSAALDVFRVTDWFFPKHMDHHHLLVALGRTANETMQVVARRMAGLGTLPDTPLPETVHRERTCDVLVIGAGSAGTAAANTLAARGLNVLCVDEASAPGGWIRDVPAAGTTVAALDPRVTFLGRHSAVATFVNGTLVVGPEGLTRVRAHSRLFANGCTETVGTFAQNDLPGVFTVRAAMRAFMAGIAVGQRVVIVGLSPGAEALEAAYRAIGVKVAHASHCTVVEAHGGRSVRAVTVRSERAETQKWSCDALVVGVEPLAAYELAGQAGADVKWDASRACFTPESDAHGRTRTAGVYVAGSLRQGTEGNDITRVMADREDGARVAEALADDLAGRCWEEAHR